jgi:hypothetical protein
MSEIIPAVESIFYVKELLANDLCQTIIANYHRDPRKHPGYAISGGGEKKLHDDVKVSTDLEISREGTWAAAFEELNRAFDGTVRQLVAQVPSLQVWPLWWTGYKIQHYPKNQGHFKWHFDAAGPSTWHRQMAVVIYLNSVQEGGETCFHRQNLRIKPIAGDAVFFPTFWTHAHCGETPRSEDKYVITSFISFVIPAAEKNGRPPAGARTVLPALKSA